MIEVIFLGTNGWYDTQTGNTISTLIRADEFNLVLDAGNGISKLSGYVNKEKPVYIFLSHFHLDHLVGLHTLCLNDFPKGVVFLFRKGGSDLLNDIMKMPYMLPLKDMPFKTEIIEIGSETTVPFRAEFSELAHKPFSTGIRILAESKVITHCLDTGYCANAVALAKDSDLLILECTLLSGTDSNTHLNPELCARIARESNCKQLALTHFEALSYPDRETRIKAGLKIKDLFANSRVCFDLDIIRL